jgi:hypothetical protein
MVISGILPFGAIFIELYFVFEALYTNTYYYLFGFLFLVMTIAFISCAQISIVVTYFLLCAENYRWWWKSFVVSGGTAFYVFLYSVYFYSKVRNEFILKLQLSLVEHNWFHTFGLVLLLLWTDRIHRGTCDWNDWFLCQLQLLVSNLQRGQNRLILIPKIVVA